MRNFLANSSSRFVWGFLILFIYGADVIAEGVDRADTEEKTTSSKVSISASRFSPCNAENVRGAALAMLEKAHGNGWSRLGSHSIEFLKEQIRDSAMDIKCVPNELNITDGRWSARFDHGNGRPILKMLPQNWDPVDEDIQGTLSAHEFFWLNGTEDRNHYFSVILHEMTLKTPQEAPLLEELMPAMQVAGGSGRSGGSTGVGGGGDEFDVRFRIAGLQAFLNGFTRAHFTNADARLRAIRLMRAFLGLNVVYSTNLNNRTIISKPLVCLNATKSESLESLGDSITVFVGRQFTADDTQAAVVAMFEAAKYAATLAVNSPKDLIDKIPKCPAAK